MFFENEMRVRICSEMYEVEASLFSDIESEEIIEEENIEGVCDTFEINTLCHVSRDGSKISITYTETEASGMENSQTSVIFDENNPNTVTMMRSGSVSATLVFEAGKRHHCMYETPFMPFEVCVFTKKAVNRLTEDGTLSIDYIVEIRGAKAERTKFTMRLFD